MGSAKFRSKTTAGLCQAIIARMPAHSVYIESHLGGTIMMRKPSALRSNGVDIDAAPFVSFAANL